jgi:hypothetical protein
MLSTPQSIMLIFQSERFSNYEKSTETFLSFHIFLTDVFSFNSVKELKAPVLQLYKVVSLLFMRFIKHLPEISSQGNSFGSEIKISKKYKNEHETFYSHAHILLFRIKPL